LIITRKNSQLAANRSLRRMEECLSDVSGTSRKLRAMSRRLAPGSGQFFWKMGRRLVSGCVPLSKGAEIPERFLRDRKCAIPLKWLAVGAVSRQPVSAPNPCLSGKFTGKIRKFAPLITQTLGFTLVRGPFPAITGCSDQGRVFGFPGTTSREAGKG